MNIVRRFFLALWSLLLIAAAAGLGVLAWQDSRQLDLAVGEFNLQAFIEVDGWERAVFTAILAASGLIGLFALVTAFVPSRAASSTRGSASKGVLRLHQADGGTVEVPASAIESLLRDELQEQPEIRKATPHVSVAGDAVTIVLDLVIEPSASIAHVTSLASSICSQTLKEQVGVTTVRRPHVRVSYDAIAARPVGMVAGPKPSFTPSTAPAYAPAPSPPPAEERKPDE